VFDRITVVWDSPAGAEAGAAWVLDHGPGVRSVHLLQPSPGGREDGARLALWAEAGRIRSALPGVEVTAHLVRDDPATRLVAQQRPGALLVLGAATRGARGPLLAELLAGAPGALLVVPPGGGTRTGPVVAGVDGSAEAVAAATDAAGLAVGRREPLVLVHAVPLEGPLPELPDDYREELLLLARGAHVGLLQDAARAVRSRFPEIPALPRLALGSAGEVLAGAAGNASMVALGRSRRQDAGRPGPVIRAVLAASGAPVLLVATGADRAGGAVPRPEGTTARP
jgi:hypothetical protein